MVKYKFQRDQKSREYLAVLIYLFTYCISCFTSSFTHLLLLPKVHRKPKCVPCVIISPCVPPRVFLLSTMNIIYAMDEKVGLGNIIESTTSSYNRIRQCLFFICVYKCYEDVVNICTAWSMLYSLINYYLFVSLTLYN